MNTSKTERILYWSFALIALPVLAILAIALAVCGAATPIAGVVQLLAARLNWDIPFIEYVTAGVGSIRFGSVGTMVVSIIAGVVFLAIGLLCWKLLRFYLAKMKK